jgi:LPS export ABC transporter protein LptC
MKKRLRFSVIALLTLLLLTVVFLVGRNLWRQRKQDLVRRGIEFLPGVSQHIQDFRRVKVQNGRKVWEVAARDAQYFEDDKTVVVRGATMQWFLKDGRTVGLTGEEGRIILDGHAIVRVEVEGDIAVTLADYRVSTAQAIYDNQRAVITAPGPIEISGRALQLHGDGMEVDVDAQRLTLLHNVSMVLQPMLHKQGGDDAPL